MTCIYQGCPNSGEPTEGVDFFLCKDHQDLMGHIMAFRARQALAELKRRHAGEPGWED